MSDETLWMLLGPDASTCNYYKYSVICKLKMLRNILFLIECTSELQMWFYITITE